MKTSNLIKLLLFGAVAGMCFGIASKTGQVILLICGALCFIGAVGAIGSQVLAWKDNGTGKK
jgi:hypothetical protein